MSSSALNAICTGKLKPISCSGAISTAKVAFHCSQGCRGAFQVGNDIELGAGPASLVIPVEDDFRLRMDMNTDPHGEQWTLKHSYGTCQPSNMTNTAFVLTACFTSA
jgi:hypothetical protein